MWGVVNPASLVCGRTHGRRVDEDVYSINPFLSFFPLSFLLLFSFYITLSLSRRVFYEPRLRELAQLANIDTFLLFRSGYGNFNLQLGLRTAPLSNLTKARRHRSKSPLVRCSLRNPLLLIDPALYTYNVPTGTYRTRYRLVGSS